MISIFCQNGLTPIYYSAQNGHTNTCELLLKHHADMNTSDQVPFEVQPRMLIGVEYQRNLSCTTDTLQMTS